MKKQPTKRQLQIVENFIKKETKRLMKKEFQQEISKEDIDDYKEDCIQIKKSMDNILSKIEAAKLDKHTIRVTAMNLKQYGYGWLKVVGR